MTARSIDHRPPVETALVLHPVRSSGHASASAQTAREPALRLDEAIGLAQALDLEIKGADLVPLRAPTPATLFGKGKTAEIGIRCAEAEIDVVVVDDALTPIQQRNLERAWKVKVIDRTGLILEIFGRRARTREGRLQVELARLAYERSRLVKTWTHLERQRGGLGAMSGPGETQIETDRRLLTARVAKLKLELTEVRRTRRL
ncbi:MAG TPA: GTPase HflX, partial [Caulobacteraceae bacterium]